MCDIKFLKSQTTVKRKMLLQRIDYTMRRNDHCRHLAGLCTFLLNTFCCVLKSVEQLQHWHLQKFCFVAQYTDRKEYWEESTVLFSTQHKKKSNLGARDYSCAVSGFGPAMPLLTLAEDLSARSRQRNVQPHARKKNLWCRGYEKYTVSKRNLSLGAWCTCKKFGFISYK